MSEVARQGGEKASAMTSLPLPALKSALPALGIAVVGYREDEEAWIKVSGSFMAFATLG